MELAFEEKEIKTKEKLESILTPLNCEKQMGKFTHFNCDDWGISFDREGMFYEITYENGRIKFKEEYL